MKYLRAAGYAVGRTEYWQATPWSTEAPGVRKDLFYFVDVMAVGHGQIIFVQTTTKANMASRFAKIVGSKPPVESEKLQGKALARAWRQYDFIRLAVIHILQTQPIGEIVVHGWAPGDRKRPIERFVAMSDLWEPPVEEQENLF